MYTVFVTGGLASGKGTVCNLFARRGAVVYDLDAIAKEEQENLLVLEALKAEFGDDMLDEQGCIDRKILAQRAFATPDKTEKLNAICWPPVRARLKELIHSDYCAHTSSGQQLANTYSIPDSPGIRAPGKRTSDTFSERMGSACANPWTESGVTYGLLVIEIPLLAEASGFVGMADEVISVEADEELRLARAIKRGMDPQDAKNRLARQATDEQRRKIANVVIDNNGSLEALEQQVESWYTDRVNEHMFFSADS